jgi:hypothetical protein
VPAKTQPYQGCLHYTQYTPGRHHSDRDPCLTAWQRSCNFAMIDCEKVKNVTVPRPSIVDVATPQSLVEDLFTLLAWRRVLCRLPSTLSCPHQDQ